MRNRRSLLISTSVLVTMIGAIFLAGSPERSSAQIDGFKLYQLSVHCGDPQLPSAIFTHSVTDVGTEGRPVAGTWTMCAGNCPDGRHSLGDALAGLPAGVSAALMAKVEKYPGAKAGWFVKCVGNDKEKPKPPPPAGGSPWNRSDCKDLQTVRFRRLGKNFVFIACGQVLGTVNENADARFLKFVGAIWPDTMCCDMYKDGGSYPCDYFSDVDCDGNHNERDDFPDNSVEAFLYTIPPGASPDPLPQGARRQQILPGSACDGGKWELMKGKNRCRSKGKSTSLTWYEATWKCTKTGMKVSKTGSPTPLQQKCK